VKYNPVKVKGNNRIALACGNSPLNIEFNAPAIRNMNTHIAIILNIFLIKNIIYLF